MLGACGGGAWLLLVVLGPWLLVALGGVGCLRGCLGLRGLAACAAAVATASWDRAQVRL